MTTDVMAAWSPAELHRHLNNGTRFAILDVRNRDEFDAWKIEGKGAIQTLNMPYFDLLDLDDENEEIAAAVARAVPARLGDSLPRRRSILVVCAKGETSPHVADGLRRVGYPAINLEGGMTAWGDHYEVRVVEETRRLTILQISRPAKGCLSYMLASGDAAMVVDAARHIEMYIRLADEHGWHIANVFDTHLKADHLSGGVPLAKKLGVDYWLHPYDSIHPDDLRPATFSFRYLEDGTAFSLGKVGVRTLHLPGHTLGMVNALVDGRYLLTGDTLFIDSVGRPDLGGRTETWAPLLFSSLQRLLTLPDPTVVLPAHFSHMRVADDQGCYRASIGTLRSRNEGLRILSEGLPAFSTYILKNLPEHPPSYDDIRRINTGLIEVDEARASELELGRNQCALSHREAGPHTAAEKGANGSPVVRT